jgi:hypothetical protein
MKQQIGRLRQQLKIIREWAKGTGTPYRQGHTNCKRPWRPGSKGRQEPNREKAGKRRREDEQHTNTPRSQPTRSCEYIMAWKSGKALCLSRCVQRKLGWETSCGRGRCQKLTTLDAITAKGGKPWATFYWGVEHTATYDEGNLAGEDE